MTKFLDAIASRFGGMTPWDAVDILLLSLFFFAIYKFVKKRRAFPALIGVAVFIGMRYAVKALGFEASLKFFDFFYRAGAVLLVLIFYYDVRAFLEKIGGMFVGSGSGLKKLLAPAKESKDAENIFKAVTRLSSSRTGALIVLENHTNTDELCKDGTLLDAKISTELLCNIFFEDAPLHDGAVVIGGKRIHKAACILPSYTDPELSASFGSRHRAAVGMSRACDAGVIVVSEEDGGVSYAIGGELDRAIELAELRKILEEYFGVKKKRIKKK